MFFAAIFSAVTVLAGSDLWMDIQEGASLLHLVVEGLLFVVGVAGLLIMVRALVRTAADTRRLQARAHSLNDKLRAKSDEAQALNEALQQKQDEAERWRSDARALMRGLGEAIDRQFDVWSLTDAEKEVALLLLKGLTHKEVAGVRDTTDATARQQARAVYKKAGLSGRNELSAFFLEDLMLPARQREEPGEVETRAG
ncbi:LuxR family transcriptional regulator [Lujinxingia litoralis]|uniref:LuxR family transcriptional regulator n=1 Tax=Lujinxingia litoralis TaxID=2211119 RepID=A0A328CDQ5_9DELT|nr:LuxR family transcriptional regulator [Lujinxingia litoralis]RAL25139.1 LuxR family transcriptional regulator [Lujinxingia litoralis]